jgi:tRNA 2-thiouridine synthesizing protein A
MSAAPGDWNYEASFDGLEMGCGELLLELKLRLGDVAPGGRMLVTTNDEGAPVDLPAWCRLTGHALLDARPPFFLIERRHERP